jgi:hypothetical protein
VPSAVSPAAVAGAERPTVGASLSIVTVRTADTWEVLPATSVTTTRSSAGPSAAVREFQTADHGAEVSVSTVVKPAAPAALTSKRTVATPEPASVAVAVIVTSPLRTAPAAGEVRSAEPGDVLSTRLTVSGVTVELPARSTTIMFSS